MNYRETVILQIANSTVSEANVNENNQVVRKSFIIAMVRGTLGIHVLLCQKTQNQSYSKRQMQETAATSNK